MTPVAWRRPTLRAWLVACLLAALCGGPAAAVMTHAGVVDRIEQLEQTAQASPHETAQALERLAGSQEVMPPGRLEALVAMASVLIEAGEHEMARPVALRLEAMAAVQTDALPAARFVRAAVAHQAGQLDEADRLLDEAAGALDRLASPVLRARILAAQAERFAARGELETAVQRYEAALALARAEGQTQRAAALLNMLAYTYAQAEQLERARELNAEAFATAGPNAGANQLARLYNVQSIILDLTGERDGERRAAIEALRHAEAAGNLRLQGLLLANLADSYLKTSEYAQALTHAQRALALSRELRQASGETVALANEGLALIGLKRLAEGRKAMEEAIALDERRGELLSMALLYRDLGEALERAGDRRGAIDALHRHRRLAETVWQREQRQSLAKLQARHEEQRRARELEVLEREGRLATERLLRADLEQRLWWLLSAVAVLLLALVALGARRLRRSNVALAAANAQLRRQGERDALTGLANRRHFLGAVGGFQREGRLHASLFVVDVDHFKRINDELGHAAGDAVLVEVGARLQRTLREGDLVARWGGEEFLLLVRTQEPAAVELLAQRLLESLAGAPVRHRDDSIPISGSIGFASFPLAVAGEPGAPVTWELALELADAAMYAAKTAGRDRAVGVQALRPLDREALMRVVRGLEAARSQGWVALRTVQARPGAPAPLAEQAVPA
jgi:diguanylate cyclase (GGDEF)-like protein